MAGLLYYKEKTHSAFFHKTLYKPLMQVTAPTSTKAFGPGDYGLHELSGKYIPRAHITLKACAGHLKENPTRLERLSLFYQKEN